MHKNSITGIVNSLKDKSYILYGIVGLLSIIVFVSIYGTQILKPSYTAWLEISGGDLTQHYLGWKAYRNSAWHFPLGISDTLSYPNNTSVIYTDSIPLVAVFFKILSPILPSTFQYFGLYGILCFILQGILTARIMKQFINSKIVVVICSVMFLYTPVMLFRMYIHTALASQWIILLGLEPIFVHKKYFNNRKLYYIVALMGLFSTSIHPYYICISGIILVGICLIQIFIYKHWKKSIFLFAEYLIIVVIVMGLLGGFVGGSKAVADGLGSYSFNLNALFNSQDKSCIFKALPLYETKQYEGFAWLGAGFITLLTFALIIFWGNGEGKQYFKKHGTEFILLCIVAGIAIMVALSPVVTFGDKLLFEVKLPDALIRVWSIFRSSGRIAWIVVYIIMLSSCIVLSKILNRKTQIILITFGLFLQIWDNQQLIKNAEKYKSVEVYNSMLDGDLWDWIAENNQIEHIVYCSAIERNIVFPITDWALEHQKTMNNFYFARANRELISKSTEESLSNPSENELFIFTEADITKTVEYNLHYYMMNGLIAGYVDKIEEFEELLPNDFYATWKFGNGQFINGGGGVDTENGRELYADGNSYGPYWAVPSGDYIITVTGEGLEEFVDVVPYSGHGTKHYNYTIINKSHSQIVISLSLDEDVSDLEICIKNNKSGAILLKQVELRTEINKS